MGIESIFQDSLDEVTNKCRVQEFESHIKRLKDNNIIVWAGFIFGFDSDKKEVFKKTVDFCVKNKIDVVNFHPLTAFPGTKLHQRMDKQDRLVRNYSITPANMTMEELFSGIKFAYKEFYSWPRIFQRTLWQIKRDWHRPLSLIKFVYLSRGYYKSADKISATSF